MFIDETWAKTNLARTYGRCPRGQRRRMGFPHGHWTTTTVIAGLTRRGMMAPFVLGGAITVELVFSYPGIGKLSFDALRKHDFPVLQGTFLVFSLAVLIANLIADVLYGYLDPRVRSAA